MKCARFEVAFLWFAGANRVQKREALHKIQKLDTRSVISLRMLAKLRRVHASLGSWGAITRSVYFGKGVEIEPMAPEVEPKDDPAYRERSSVGCGPC